MTFLKPVLTSTTALALMAGAAFAQSEMTSEGTAQAADPAIVATDHSAMVHGSADVTASDVTGTPVVLSDGERIGEIDHLGTMNGEPVLVVGVGGFLGLGEHDVAMTLDQLTYDSEQMAFVAAGQTEEQLREMPQYDESQVALVEDDQPLGAEWADIAAVKADAGMDGMTADATDGMADPMATNPMATEATDLTAEAKNDTAMETEPVAPLAGNDTMAGETAAPAPSTSASNMPISPRCPWTRSSARGSIPRRVKMWAKSTMSAFSTPNPSWSSASAASWGWANMTSR